MNIHRNILTIVAGALLLASLPAGAQVLGGGIAGAAGGALGGSLGPQGLGGGGSAGASSHGGFDGAGTFGAVRDRSQQVGGRTREVAGNASGATRSRAETVRGNTAATADTAHAAGASASAGRRAAESAPQPAAPSLQPDGGLVLEGGGSAGAEKHAMGHGITALGSTDSQGSADRSGVRYSGNGKADMGVKKDEPAPVPAQ